MAQFGVLAFLFLFLFAGCGESEEASAPDGSLSPAADASDTDDAGSGVEDEHREPREDAPDLGVQEDIREDPFEEGLCDQFWPEPSGHVYLYRDGGTLSTSWYQQLFSDPDDSPWSGVPLALLGGPSQVVFESETCPNGLAKFGPLSPGLYVWHIEAPEVDEVTSSNLARGFPAAVREDSVEMLVFGDSIPVMGSDQPFPDRFRELVAPMTTVEVYNVAVPGSTAAEWRPGTRYFADRVGPRLTQADVIVFSLGGNDVLLELASADRTDIIGTLESLDKTIEEVTASIIDIAAVLRRKAPQADIVWLVYPNYAKTTFVRVLAGDFAEVAEALLDMRLTAIRQKIARQTDMLLLDMLGATQDRVLNNYLADQIHLNDAGHLLYAEELFVLLGGIIVRDESRGLQRGVGFAGVKP